MYVLARALAAHTLDALRAELTPTDAPEGLAALPGRVADAAARGAGGQMPMPARDAEGA